MMIKILYFIDSLMAGGIERQLVELVTRLDREIFDVQVVCLYSERAGRSLHFEKHLIDAQIPLINLDLDWSARSKFIAIRKITALIQEIRPNIVHALNYHSNLFTRLSRPFWRTNTKLLASVRNAQTPKQKFYTWAGQWLFDAIVCNGQQLEKSLIEDVRIAEQKVFLIQNGIDLARFQDALTTVTSISFPQDMRRMILMIGRITEQKSPHLLVEAVGVLQRRGQWDEHDKLIIVGEMQLTDQKWYDKLTTAIATNQLQDVVYMFGKTTTPEAFYHQAYITVLPSLWEGLPNVMLESLATGTPIIISEAANKAGVIEHEQEGWVIQTGDVAALAIALRDALSLSTTNYEAMTANCLTTIEQFAMHKMVNKYRDLYEKLVEW